MFINIYFNEGRLRVKKLLNSQLAQVTGGLSQPTVFINHWDNNTGTGYFTLLFKKSEWDSEDYAMKSINDIQSDNQYVAFRTISMSSRLMWNRGIGMTVHSPSVDDGPGGTFLVTVNYERNLAWSHHHIIPVGPK
jgi:hypothetical protein